MGKHGYNPGDIGWNQLNTTDPKAAIEFYSKLFGWEEKEAPMPDYHVFASGGEMLGGITPLGEGGTPTPNWVPYVTVKNIDETIEKLKSLGGTILLEPTDLPDGGKMAVFRDPQGAITALAQYGRGPSED